MQHGSLSAAFRSWTGSVRNAQHQAVVDAYEEKARVARELRLSQLLERKRQKRGTTVLRAWRVYTEKAIRYGVVVARTDAARRQKLKKTTFGSWVRALVHAHLPTSDTAEDLNQALIRDSKVFMQMLNLHRENEASLQRSAADSRAAVESLEEELNAQRVVAEEQRVIAEERALRLAAADDQIEQDTETIRSLTRQLQVAETRIADADAQTVATVDELKVLLARKRAEHDAQVAHKHFALSHSLPHTRLRSACG